MRNQYKALTGESMVARLRPTGCWAVVILSSVVGWQAITLSVAVAQSTSMVLASLTERGKVTDLSEQTIVIDGRAYEVDQHVEVFDDEGHQVDLSAVTRNAEVRFRVKRDNAHKIDKIMVYLAR